MEQGFRKYLTQARDHEELLAFILGQIVKEKARFYQLQKHSQPESIAVSVAELDERVSFLVFPVSVRSDANGRRYRRRSTTFTTRLRSCGQNCFLRMDTR